MAVTSTALDAALCLLLISAGAVTLASVQDETPEDGGADATAETLATSTADVSYALSLGPRRTGGPSPSSPETDRAAFERTAHGTYAELLSDATVRRPIVNGTRIGRTNDGFAREVRRVTRGATGPRVQVVAAWRPYRGSHVAGTLTVGDTPPSTADVHAATLSVPSGFPATREDTVAAAEEGGFSAVSALLAERIVGGTFPPTRTRRALRDDYPVRALAEHRYRRAARRYDADLGATVERGNVTAANERLADAVARAVERDLRREFETPEAAARTVEMRSVRITVRTWSA
ncbi:DUF7284 family protein [Halegenticoccus tardaugens]|uniref:DUF7284 family protein n=1 Tax=Halegenticoccus tardaugens TaxID=2071624 RepID=UPI00100B16A6|nr:hypothetical protein [Halegenticoccus tardaugens]